MGLREHWNPTNLGGSNGEFAIFEKSCGQFKIKILALWLLLALLLMVFPHNHGSGAGAQVRGVAGALDPQG